MAVYLKYCKQTAENVTKFSEIEKIRHFSNIFWFYQHGVKSELFQSCSLLILEIVNGTVGTPCILVKNELSFSETWRF